MRSLVVGILFVTAIGGCATNGDQLDPGETDDGAATGKDDSTALQLGQYAISPDYAAFWQVTLGSSSKMTLRGGCKPPPPGQQACFAITSESGTFKLTKSGTTKYLRLYNASDDLIVKFQYTTTTTTGAKLTDTSDSSNKFTAKLVPDPSTPVGLFQTDVGTKTLACVPSFDDPKVFKFSIVAGEISVDAENSRDGTYSVDSAKISSNALKLSLSNDVDGPLAEDTIEIPTANLDALASGTTSVSGTDTYSEQYDGTTSHYTLKCTLE